MSFDNVVVAAFDYSSMRLCSLQIQKTLDSRSCYVSSFSRLGSYAVIIFDWFQVCLFQKHLSHERASVSTYCFLVPRFDVFSDLFPKDSK